MTSGPQRSCGGGRGGQGSVGVSGSGSLHSSSWWVVLARCKVAVRDSVVGTLTAVDLVVWTHRSLASWHSPLVHLMATVVAAFFATLFKKVSWFSVCLKFCLSPSACPYYRFAFSIPSGFLFVRRRSARELKISSCDAALLERSSSRRNNFTSVTVLLSFHFDLLRLLRNFLEEHDKLPIPVRFCCGLS